MLTLDVLISTIYSAGIHRVAAMQLPVMDGVRYIVSWQCPEGKIPAELCRSDIEITQMNERGLSRNRNNALAHSTADICLISDDDLVYTAEQLQKVIDAFERHPEVEVACFCYKGDHKRYPVEITDISKRLPKGYFVTSFELAFRREAAANTDLRFNELTGIAAPVLQAAEDEFFLLDAQRRGLICYFFPVVICRHNGPTTGYRPLSDGAVMAGGAYLAAQYGLLSALPRIPLWAFRRWRKRQVPLLRSIVNLIRGYCYAIKHRL